MKDIVSESASTYISVLQPLDEPEKTPSSSKQSADTSSVDLPTAFSLAKFIPLLQERIHVINPFTRVFLVAWVSLLDTIPDLELVFYLPEFIGGLFKFLSDPNKDVHIATQGALERFLNEIKKIARIKRGIVESRKEQSDDRARQSNSSDSASLNTDRSGIDKSAIADDDSTLGQDEKSGEVDGDWVPGQDVQIDHSKILDILVAFLDSPSGIHSLNSFTRNTDPLPQKRRYNLQHYAGLMRSSRSVQTTFYPSFHGYYHKFSQLWPAVRTLSGMPPIDSTTH